jgi:hypothetical protein
MDRNGKTITKEQVNRLKDSVASLAAQIDDIAGKDTSNTDTIRDDNERRLLALYRKAVGADEEEKKAIVDNFQYTIEMYLIAKGLK